ncbi:MAG: hemerythrin domain-containing protein [Clostridiales bacterium]|nr:hemerythrin domain-containing protein [Clostridiales bacterium]
MNSIQLMVEEHVNIMRMLKVVRNACNKILQGEEICYGDFDKMIDFIRIYADEHHHGKEEKFLFKEMVDRLGKMGSNLITHGMLVEHDWGRLFIRELKDALERTKSGDEESKLDVIANAVGYANHLTRHIAKEDQVVYSYAEKQLDKETLDTVNQQTKEFEEEATKQGIQTHYIKMLEELEEKYN